MVVIRLSRCGAKKRPFYRIVATDSRNKRDGRYIQQVGYYNPLDKKSDNAISINLEHLDEWLANGAQMSDRVAYLVKKFKKAAEAPAEAVAPAKKAAAAKESKPAAKKEAKPAAKKAAPAKPKAAPAKAAKPAAKKEAKPAAKKDSE